MFVQRRKTQMDSELQRIHWSQLPFNKYLKKIEPMMLADDGLINKQLIGSAGRIKQPAKRWIEVVYDKKYVVNKIAIELDHLIKVISPSYFIEIVTEGWFVVHPMSVKEKREKLHEFMLGLLEVMEKNKESIVDAENQ